MKTITLKKVIAGVIMSGLIILGGVPNVLAKPMGTSHNTPAAAGVVTSSGPTAASNTTKKNHGNKRASKAVSTHSAPSGAQSLAGQEATSNHTTATVMKKVSRTMAKVFTPSN